MILSIPVTHVVITHQVKAKRSLENLQNTIHEEIITHAEIKTLYCLMLQGNKTYLPTYARNVNTRQLQRVLSLDTSKPYMRARSTHVGNVTTLQIEGVVSLNTSKC